MSKMSGSSRKRKTSQPTQRFGSFEAEESCATALLALRNSNIEPSEDTIVSSINLPTTVARTTSRAVAASVEREDEELPVAQPMNKKRGKNKERKKNKKTKKSTDVELNQQLEEEAMRAKKKKEEMVRKGQKTKEANRKDDYAACAKQFTAAVKAVNVDEKKVIPLLVKLQWKAVYVRNDDYIVPPETFATLKNKSRSNYKYTFQPKDLTSFVKGKDYFPSGEVGYNKGLMSFLQKGGWEP